MTQTQITFFVDGKNSSAVHLARPVTDCVGQALEIGDDDIPQLGEITFFARALTEVEMHVCVCVREILRRGDAQITIGVPIYIYIYIYIYTGETVLQSSNFSL